MGRPTGEGIGKAFVLGVALLFAAYLSDWLKPIVEGEWGMSPNVTKLGSSLLTAIGLYILYGIVFARPQLEVSWYSSNNRITGELKTVTIEAVKGSEKAFAVSASLKGRTFVALALLFLIERRRHELTVWIQSPGWLSIVGERRFRSRSDLVSRGASAVSCPWDPPQKGDPRQLVGVVNFVVSGDVLDVSAEPFAVRYDLMPQVAYIKERKWLGRALDSLLTRGVARRVKVTKIHVQ